MHLSCAENQHRLSIIHTRATTTACMHHFHAIASAYFQQRLPHFTQGCCGCISPLARAWWWLILQHFLSACPHICSTRAIQLQGKLQIKAQAIVPGNTPRSNLAAPLGANSPLELNSLLSVVQSPQCVTTPHTPTPLATPPRHHQKKLMNVKTLRHITTASICAWWALTPILL